MSAWGLRACYWRARRWWRRRELRREVAAARDLFRYGLITSAEFDARLLDVCRRDMQEGN